MPRVLQVMFSRCTDAARDDEFNRWYSRTHLVDLAAAPGFVSGRRFCNAMPTPGSAPYMVIYELDAPSAMHALRDLTRQALAAFDRGRHIDCIEGVAAGNSPLGGQWEEIDPASLDPLEVLDYPPASPEIRERMVQLIEELGRALERPTSQ